MRGKCRSLLYTECEVNCHGNVILYYLCNEERLSFHFQPHFPSMIIFLYYTACCSKICNTFSCFRRFCSTEAYITILLCSCRAILLRHNVHNNTAVFLPCDSLTSQRTAIAVTSPAVKYKRITALNSSKICFVSSDM